MKQTAIELYDRLTNVPLAAWHRKGITCLLVDVDSTLTTWCGVDVDPATRAMLAEARRKGHITYLGLVSNAGGPGEKRVKRLAKLVGADAYFVPSKFLDHKPSPRLIQKAMQQFGVSASQVGVVGDKYTADVWAARGAGVARVAWVNRLGSGDAPFDRLVRRPIEAIIRRRLNKQTAN